VLLDLRIFITRVYGKYDISTRPALESVALLVRTDAIGC